MEILLFDSYRVFQKGRIRSIVQRLKKLPLPAIVLFLVMFAMVIGAIVALFCTDFIVYFICFGIEILIGISASFYIENFQLKTVNERLTTYCTYSNDVYKWLVGTGFVTTKANVQELLMRVNQQIERRTNSRKEKNATIRHIIDILLVPFLLAIFSLWMTGKTELGVLMVGAIAILSAVGVFAMIGYFVYNIFSFYRKRELEQWRCFANDLQGVIDTQLEEKMFVNPS